MASAVERMDELVREYLLYREFTSTLKTFDIEIKTDKDKGFRVDKIVEQLQHLVQGYDLSGLREYWGYLDRRLFSRLEDAYRHTVNKLKTSLYRYYLIHTIQSNRIDKTQEFFQKQALELQSQPEWKEWFVLPFVPNPDQNLVFATYFSKQWAETFLVSLHNFLSVLFQCMPVPMLLNFDAEVQRCYQLQEENEVLRQKLFAAQAEPRLRKEEEMIHHKLPPYIQNMDRLGDSELELMSSQRASSVMSSQSKAGSFLSLLLPQSKKPSGKGQMYPGPSQSCQSPVLSGKRDGANNQTTKNRESLASKEGKVLVNMATDITLPQRQRKVQDHEKDPNLVQQRQRKVLNHEKERKELLSKHTTQGMEKSTEPGCTEMDIPSSPEMAVDQLDSPTKLSKCSLERKTEQPFIVLSQEEYAEHHSSIMYCGVDCSGRRVASLDIDGVVKVWTFNPTMQTKATIMSKSQLLSLEWATKPDRLLLLGSGVGTVRLYDTEAKKSLYELTVDESYPRILSLSCSPSGASFVCSSAAPSTKLGTVIETGDKGANLVPGDLLLWDTKTMKQQHQFSLDPEPIAINCTAFNHNGNLLVTGAADGIIRLFDMQRYDCAMSWNAHSGEVYSVEFSYDENSVYSIGEDGKFIQWNIHKSGVKVSECEMQSDAIGPFVLSGYSGYKQVQVPRGRLFAFDSEGHYVLTCSSSGGIIHKLTNSEQILEPCLSLGGHRAPVVTVDWCTAMDCGTCLTASMDGRIKLTTLLAQKA
ncbi:WD repeat-containing protein 91 isoform X1 [Hemiscyllium ocellatum]|uniref:WD repeat-containing protein 91 isoform X1 n=2 Tax=Hemiscyllium ocellatum TaxID=170820 RepID=UPI00296775E0|nr:WD repeat-containing protein 91 isoform X1 [Hemiscyllium ocellatum]XP_060695515.1 WD repeat-containing protein 91 isoform X1 [Hemiscyllium ocellatum]